jgi:hypothetical protein
METLQTQPEVENNADFVKYEPLGEPLTVNVGERGFVEVAHRRAIFKSGKTSDYVLIARGYYDRAGRKRTARYVTVPAAVAPAIAAVLGVGGAELRSPQQRLDEAGEA